MYTNIMDLALNAGETKVIPHSLTKKLFTDMSYPWLIIVEPFPHDSTKGAHIELVSWDKNSITLRNTEAVTVPIMLYMDQMHSVSTAHKVSSEYTPQIPPIVAPNFGTLPSSETLSTDGTRVRSPMYINLKDTIGVAFNPDDYMIRYVNPSAAGSGWSVGDDANTGEDKAHPWLSLQTAINRWPDNKLAYIIKCNSGVFTEDISIPNISRSGSIFIMGTYDHVQDDLVPSWNISEIRNSVNPTPNQIDIVGDITSSIIINDYIQIAGATAAPANNGMYTVLNIVFAAGVTTITTNEAIATDSSSDGKLYRCHWQANDPAYPELWNSIIVRLDSAISSYDDIVKDYLLFIVDFFGTYYDCELKILEYEVIDPFNFIYKLKLGGYGTQWFTLDYLTNFSRIRPATIIRGDATTLPAGKFYWISNIVDSGNYGGLYISGIQLGDGLTPTGKRSQLNGLHTFGNVNFYRSDYETNSKIKLFALAWGIIREKNLFGLLKNLEYDYTYNSIGFTQSNISYIGNENACLIMDGTTNFSGTLNIFILNKEKDVLTKFEFEFYGSPMLFDFYARYTQCRVMAGDVYIFYRATLGNCLDIYADDYKQIKTGLYLVNSPNVPVGYKNSFFGNATLLKDPWYSDSYIGRIYMCGSELKSTTTFYMPDDISLSRHYMHLDNQSLFQSISATAIECEKTHGALGDSFWIENGSKFFCLGDITTNRDCIDLGVDHNYIFKVIDSEIDVGDVNSTIEAEGASACLQGGFYLENSKAIFDSFLLNHERDISSSTFGQNGNGMFVMNGDSSLIFRNTISGRLHESLLLTREAVGGSPLIANQFAMFRALDSYKITSVGYLAFEGDNSAGAASGHYFYFDGEGSFNLYGLVVLEAEEVNAVQGFGAKLIPIEILNGGKGYLSNGVSCQVFGGAELGLYTRFLKLKFNCSLVTASLDLRAGSETITTPEAYNLSDVDVVYDSSLIVTTNSSDIKNYMDCRYFDTWTAYGNRYASLYVLNSEFINLPRIDFTLEKGGRVLNFLNSSIKTGGLRYRGNHLGAAVIPTIGVTPYPTDVYVNSNSDVCMFINSIDFVSGDYGDYSALAQAYLNFYDYVHGPVVIDDQSNIVIECEPTEATTPGYNLFVATAYSPGNFAVALRNASVITGKILHNPDTRAIWYWACLTDDAPTTYQDFWLGSVTAVASVAEWPGGRNGKWNDVNADSVGLAGDPGTCELVLVSLPVGNPD